MKNAALYLYHPTTKEETLLELLGDEATIGRSEGADIRLSDSRCSGIHAYICTSGNPADFFVFDLGSAAGITIKGKRVDAARLKSGDVFTIGTSRLRVKSLPKTLQGFSLLDEDSLTSEEDKIKDATPGSTPERKADIKVSKTRQSSVLTDTLLQVSLYWGQKLLDVKTFPEHSDVTIGSDRKATFNVTLPQKNILKIAHYKEGRVFLDLPRDVGGVIWRGEELTLLNEIQTKPLDGILRLGDRADIQLGELTLSFRFVKPSEMLPSFTAPKLDRNLIRVYGFILLFLVVFTSIFSIWKPTKHEDEKPLAQVSRKLKRIVFDAGMKNAQKKQQSAIGEIRNNEGGRARSEEGASTARKSPEEPKLQQASKPDTPNPAAEIAKNKLKIKNIFGSSNGEKNQENPDESSVLSNVHQAGNTVSALAKGNYARGQLGLGAGGGGESVGIGQLKGLGEGGGSGADNFGLKPSKGHEVEVPGSEQIEILGGLDPDVIAAIIKRYLSQIQNCYETRLVEHPKLQGKVVVGFKIIGDGTTQSPRVLDSSLRDGPTEECILKRIEKWVFPKPKGGGVVGVKYPFLLMTTQENR